MPLVLRLVSTNTSRSCGRDGPWTKLGRPPQRKRNEKSCTGFGRRPSLVLSTGSIKWPGTSDLKVTVRRLTSFRQQSIVNVLSTYRQKESSNVVSILR